MKNDNIRVRFAPSPTGRLHIGNIRVAIFNWLFAKKNNGKFLLRIEDTDKNRSSDIFVRDIIDCISWFNIELDDEVYYQSRYVSNHINAAKKLIDKKFAYTINSDFPIYFRIPINLDNCNNINRIGINELYVIENSKIYIDYSGVSFLEKKEDNISIERKACFSGLLDLIIFNKNEEQIFKINDCNIQSIFEGKKSYVIDNCYKISFTKREVFFNDLVKGRLSKSLDSMEDFIIIKSDSFPVFHLSNVYDDINQNITHIIRGNDHIDNTYKHILMFNALGSRVPQYGHLPMIVNRDNKPYSKRDGDIFVLNFRDNGFLQETMFNYLISLGWIAIDDTKDMPRTDLIKDFLLDKINHSPAKFDMDKLLDLNQFYISKMEDDDFINLTREFSISQKWGNYISDEKFREISKFLKSRTNSFKQIIDWRYFFFECSPIFCTDLNNDMDDNLLLNNCFFNYNEDAIKKIISIDIDIVIKLINDCIEILLENNLDFSLDFIDFFISSIEKLNKSKIKNVKLILRIILTGSYNGIGLRDTIYLIGKKIILNRLQQFRIVIDKIFKRFRNE